MNAIIQLKKNMRFVCLISSLVLVGVSAAFSETSERRTAVTPLPRPEVVLPPARSQFLVLDKNQDGVLSRYEWQGAPETFDAKDKNQDTVLTFEEFSASVSTQEKFFREQDQNLDGKISRREWKLSQQIFEKFDANRDGVLVLSEIPNNFDPSNSQQPDRFDALDWNQDGTITINEWKKSKNGFVSLDQNSDGRLIRAELTQDVDQDGDLDHIDLWATLDRNKDAWVEQKEWNKNYGDFTHYDTNGDHRLSRKEFLKLGRRQIPLK